MRSQASTGQRNGSVQRGGRDRAGDRVGVGAGWSAMAIAGLVGLGVVASPALGQADSLTPPRPQGDVAAKTGTNVIKYGGLAVIVGIVGLAALFPSKRGHQD